jgi:hypothetical protein
MCQARSDFGLAILTAGLLAACIEANAGCSGKTPLAPDGAGADPGTTTTAESPQTASDVAVEAAPALAGEAGEAGLAIHSEALQAPAAARYTSPLSQGCIRQFYDASFYGWLALQNACPQSIYVLYIAFNPGYGGSSVTLRPNQKSSTGYSRTEVQRKRGYQFFLCPAGYYPVDASNRFVNRVNTAYRCQQAR